MCPSASVSETARCTGPVRGSTMVRRSSRLSALRSHGWARSSPPLAPADVHPTSRNCRWETPVKKSLGQCGARTELSFFWHARVVGGVGHAVAQPYGGRGVGARGAVEAGPDGHDAAADRVAADVGVAGRRHGDRAAVEHRQHRVVAVGEQVDGAGDVGPADLALLRGAEPGRARRCRMCGLGSAPVVERRRSREAGRPLGVEEVVVGAHHQHRAVEGQVVGRVGRDVAAVVGEVLPLQVAHVTVAVRQDRDRRRRRRGLEPEVRGADQHLTGRRGSPRRRAGRARRG